MTAVAYHMEGYTPRQLIAMQKHHRREDRDRMDLEHCDPDRLRLNEIIHGDHFWAEKFIAEVETYKKLNMKNEVAMLHKRGRHKEADRRHIKGGVDPWKMSGTLGPVRSIILTADSSFFAQPGFEDFEGADFRDPAKVRQFRDLAIGFLDKHIPREFCLFMTYEHDEKTPHFHAYYRAWNVKESKTKGVQRMLQPTDMVHFRNAEKAQDEVGKWFAPMGLTRGRKTAEARREARALGMVPPAKAKRTEPWQWRMQQRLQLVDAMKKSEAAAQIEEEKRLAARAERVAARKEREDLSQALIEDKQRRDRDEAAHMQRLRDASQRAQRAAEERRRRDDEAAAERRKKADEAMVAKIRQADAERAARIRREDAERAEREAALVSRESDLKRKTKLLVSALREFETLGDAIRAAARAVGLLDHPLVQTGADALAKMRQLVGGIGGNGRVK